MFFVSSKFLKCRPNKALLFEISVRQISWRALFFGSDEFSLYSLSKLHNLILDRKHMKTLDVVTTTGAAKANIVKRFADKNNIDVIGWPPKDLKSYDVGIVVSFGHLIPKRIIDHFPLGVINVHASLLPRWRGASPIVHSMMNGDTETGVTIMRINPHHFDTGHIIMQKSCAIDKEELMPSLHRKLGILGSELLLETVSSLPDCLHRSQPQTNEGVSFAPRLKAEIADIQWSEYTDVEVYNRYRALYSLFDLKTNWYGVPVKLKNIKLLEAPSEAPGIIQWDKKLKIIHVACRSGSIAVDRLSLGGKPLRAIDFYNGYLSKRSRREWIFTDVR